MVTEQNERLSKLVRTLLDMSELQTVARNEKIEMQGLIEEVLADLEPLAQEKNIELIQKTQNSSDGRTGGTEESLLVACSVNSNEKPEDELILTGSDILIYRMLYNLVENAIKYNHENGWVHVSLNADHKYFYLKVEDSGLGIPQEDQAHIFERFYRVDKSHSREIGGTGLGLAIARNAVIVHRGSIKVHSNEGEGTTFTVRIPLIYTTVPEGVGR